MNSGEYAGEYGVYNAGSIAILQNSGSITGSATALRNELGTIGTLVNTGAIFSSGSGIYNNGSIGLLENLLLIHGSTGIDNMGVIGSLSNSGTI